MAEDTALLVATVRNEGPFLLEWIAYHRLCGFDHIQVFDAGSTDTTIQTLRLLDKIGAVEFHQAPTRRGNTQLRSLRHVAQSEAYRAAKWCMVLDPCDFLHIPAEGNCVQTLGATCPERATALAIPVRTLFGQPQGTDTTALVSEHGKYAERQTEFDIEQTPISCLFQTDAYTRPGARVPRGPHGEAMMVAQTDADQRAEVLTYPLREAADYLLRASDPASAVDAMEAVAQNAEENTLRTFRALKTWSEMKRLDEITDGKLLRLRRRGQRQMRRSFKTMLQQDGSIEDLYSRLLNLEPAKRALPAFKLPTPNVPIFKSTRSPQNELPSPKRAAGSA